MPLLAIPNISAGPGAPVLEAATTAVVDAGARLLDLHSDAVHARSVLTVTADDDTLVDAMIALARVCKDIDLSSHAGIHPRVGALDVCPFVPFATSMDRAIAAAHNAGRAIAAEMTAPVFFYGAAARSPENTQLPDIRRGGLEALTPRMAAGFAPDEGPAEVDPRYGVVLVGARGPLIAFNVWLQTTAATARSIAAEVREPGRIRALGLPVDATRSQVSMNLIAPHDVSIEDAFSGVHAAALRARAAVAATEIVGLVEERFLPEPDAQAARLLIEPGHSVESALRG